MNARSASARPKAPLYVLSGALVLFTISALLFGIPQVRQAAQMGKADRARVQAMSVSRACERWLGERGSLPEDLTPDFVRQLSQQTDANGEYFLLVSADWTNELGQLLDPWGEPLRLVQDDARGLSVRSSGPNRRVGDGDDLIVRATTTDAEGSR